MQPPRNISRPPRRLAALRAALARGIAALDRGDYVEVDERELRSFLEGLGVSAASARRGR